MQAQHLIGLEVENFKKLKAVKLKFDKKNGLVVLKGKNKAGKSSALESIIGALGGKKHVIDKPVREGAAYAKVILTTEDLIITHRWTKNGGDELEVTSTDNKTLPYKSPQTLLSTFFDTVAFDPIKFADMDEKKQAEKLLEICPTDFDLAANAEKIKAAKLKRRDANRDLKKLKAQLEGMPEPDKDLPKEEVKISDLIDSRSSWEKVQQEQKEDRDAVALSENNIATCKERDEKAHLKTVQLKRDLVAKKKELDDEHKRRWTEAEEAHEEKMREIDVETRRLAISLQENQKYIEKMNKELSESSDVQPEIDKITKQINGAEAVNEKIRQAHNRRVMESSVKADSECAAKLGDDVEELEKEREEAIKEAKFPLEALNVDEGGIVLFNGHPLSQASDAEKVGVGCEIAVAANPMLKLAFVPQGSMLDDDSKELLSEMAVEKDILVFFEVVKTDDPSAIHIVDGEVAD